MHEEIIKALRELFTTNRVEIKIDAEETKEENHCIKLAVYIEDEIVYESETYIYSSHQ